jgi:OOP family OmpA-OmpF porin
LLALGAGLLLVASPLAAQDDYGRGGFEINGFYGVLNGIGNEYQDDFQPFEIDNNQYFGGRLGYVLPAGLGIEGFFGYLTDSKVTGVGGGDIKAKAMNYGGDLTYAFQLEKNLQLFIAGGAGYSEFEIKDPIEGIFTGGETGATNPPAKEGAFTWNFGAGIKMFLSRALALRLDWRQYYSPDGLKDTRCQINGLDPDPNLTPGCYGTGINQLESKTLAYYEFTGGLSLFLGGPKDSDGDGVPDARDACPDTPKGVAVDESGCPFDTDMDGVYDYMDQCPDTPRGARVDANGCPTDQDGDGVFDGLDQCPNTPAGATVDSKGCPMDSDGDGVYDGIDQCPNTPAGAVVDAKGCPMDSDGDGVYDGLDQCPGTPAGADVDENGCTVFEAGIARGELVLQGTKFRLNSFEILDESKPNLELVAQAIANRLNVDPNLTVEVQGYTDSTGSEAYNLKLSQQRAEAVRDFLVSVKPGIADAVTAKGYGETDPIAENSTADGRALNRRVEFVVTNR